MTWKEFKEMVEKVANDNTEIRYIDFSYEPVSIIINDEDQLEVY